MGDVGTPQCLGGWGCCSHLLIANGTLHSSFLPGGNPFSADKPTQSRRLEYFLKSVIPRSQQLSPPRPAVCSPNCSFCHRLSPLAQAPSCTVPPEAGSSGSLSNFPVHNAKTLPCCFWANGDAPRHHSQFLSTQGCCSVASVGFAELL